MAMDQPTAETMEAPIEMTAPASEGAAAVAAPAPSERIAKLADQVEAILVTSGKAVSATRLAQAVGLIAPPEPGVAAAEGEAAGAEATPAPVVVKKRGKKQANPEDPLGLIRQAVEALNAIYATSGRTFRVEPVAGAYRLMTRPDYSQLIATFHGQGASSRLSKAAVETLAIIAYKQPATRAQLEAVRGVACGEVLRSLMERRLVTIVGRAEELGRPILYGTTRSFLEAFGLSSLKDLPQPGEVGFGKAG
ncbi:MAG: SMC-Scp complex subunit ScpB [Phycisphaerales bacterium]